MRIIYRLFFASILLTAELCAGGISDTIALLNSKDDTWVNQNTLDVRYRQNSWYDTTSPSAPAVSCFVKPNSDKVAGIIFKAYRFFHGHTAGNMEIFGIFLEDQFISFKVFDADMNIVGFHKFQLDADFILEANQWVYLEVETIGTDFIVRQNKGDNQTRVVLDGRTATPVAVDNTHNVRPVFPGGTLVPMHKYSFSGTHQSTSYFRCYDHQPGRYYLTHEAPAELLAFEQEAVVRTQKASRAEIETHKETLNGLSFTNATIDLGETLFSPEELAEARQHLEGEGAELLPRIEQAQQRIQDALNTKKAEHQEQVEQIITATLLTITDAITAVQTSSDRTSLLPELARFNVQKKILSTLMSSIDFGSTLLTPLIDKINELASLFGDVATSVGIFDTIAMLNNKDEAWAQENAITAPVNDFSWTDMPATTTPKTSCFAKGLFANIWWRMPNGGAFGIKIERRNIHVMRYESDFTFVARHTYQILPNITDVILDPERWSYIEAEVIGSDIVVRQNKGANKTQVLLDTRTASITRADGEGSPLPLDANDNMLALNGYSFSTKVSGYAIYIYHAHPHFFYKTSRPPVLAAFEAEVAEREEKARRASITTNTLTINSIPITNASIDLSGSLFTEEKLQLVRNQLTGEEEHLRPLVDAGQQRIAAALESTKGERESIIQTIINSTIVKMDTDLTTIQRNIDMLPEDSDSPDYAAVLVANKRFGYSLTAYSKQRKILADLLTLIGSEQTILQPLNDKIAAYAALLSMQEPTPTNSKSIADTLAMLNNATQAWQDTHVQKAPSSSPDWVAIPASEDIKLSTFIKVGPQANISASFRSQNGEAFGIYTRAASGTIPQTIMTAPFGTGFREQYILAPDLESNRWYHLEIDANPVRILVRINNGTDPAITILDSRNKERPGSSLSGDRMNYYKGPITAYSFSQHSPGLPPLEYYQPTLGFFYDTHESPEVAAFKEQAAQRVAQVNELDITTSPLTTSGVDITDISLDFGSFPFSEEQIAGIKKQLSEELHSQVDDAAATVQRAIEQRKSTWQTQIQPVITQAIAALDSDLTEMLSLTDDQRLEYAPRLTGHMRQKQIIISMLEKITSGTATVAALDNKIAQYVSYTNAPLGNWAAEHTSQIVAQFATLTDESGQITQDGTNWHDIPATQAPFLNLFVKPGGSGFTGHVTIAFRSASAEPQSFGFIILSNWIYVTMFGENLEPTRYKSYQISSPPPNDVWTNLEISTDGTDFVIETISSNGERSMLLNTAEQEQAGGTVAADIALLTNVTFDAYCIGHTYSDHPCRYTDPTLFTPSLPALNELKQIALARIEQVKELSVITTEILVEEHPITNATLDLSGIAIEQTDVEIVKHQADAAQAPLLKKHADVLAAAVINEIDARRPLWQETAQGITTNTITAVNEAIGTIEGSSAEQRIQLGKRLTAYKQQRDILTTLLTTINLDSTVIEELNTALTTFETSLNSTNEQVRALLDHLRALNTALPAFLTSLAALPSIDHIDYATLRQLTTAQQAYTDAGQSMTIFTSIVEQIETAKQQARDALILTADEQYTAFQTTALALSDDNIRTMPSNQFNLLTPRGALDAQLNYSKVRNALRAAKKAAEYYDVVETRNTIAEKIQERIALAATAARLQEEDETTEPETTEPETTEPETTEPEPTEPETTEPETTEPETTEPETTEPAPTEPETTEPEITEPETTEPEITEPETTEPETTEPEPTEPETTEPETTEPETTEPEPTEPEPTEPETTEPETTEPETAEPETTEPETTEPEPTEPEEQEEEEVIEPTIIRSQADGSIVIQSGTSQAEPLINNEVIFAADGSAGIKTLFADESGNQYAVIIDRTGKPTITHNNSIIGFNRTLSFGSSDFNPGDYPLNKHTYKISTSTALDGDITYLYFHITKYVDNKPERPGRSSPIKVTGPPTTVAFARASSFPVTVKKLTNIIPIDDSTASTSVDSSNGVVVVAPEQEQSATQKRVYYSAAQRSQRRV